MHDLSNKELHPKLVYQICMYYLHNEIAFPIELYNGEVSYQRIYYKMNVGIELCKSIQ